MLNKENFQISVEGKEIELDRTSLKAGNITNLPNNRISLITGNRSYTSKVLQVNTADKTVTLQMYGKSYQIKIQDELDMQLKTMGFNNSSARKLKEIKAPMPGMVLEVNVQEGNQLEAGSKLLVLEAMKMENVIVLPAGTGHRQQRADDDFVVVGAYPPDQQWDICRSEPTQAMLERIEHLSFPASDPVSGANGPLTKQWPRTITS